MTNLQNNSIPNGIKNIEDSPCNRRPCGHGTALKLNFRSKSTEVEGTPSFGAFLLSPPVIFNSVAGDNGYTPLAAVHTLAQLDTNRKILQKRGRSKYITNNISIKLGALGSPLNKSYWNSYYCCETLKQSDQKLTGKYCNNRWCLTCNRIRTAKLINGYAMALKELTDKRFVTLTVPNVPAQTLKQTLEDMTQTFQDIRQTFVKRSKRLGGENKRLVGIRKTEVTFNPHTQAFHPHFHLVISGTNVSQTLIAEWLKRYPLAVMQAQDNRPALDGAEMELFKYFTKMVTKKRFYINALDVIFRAMRNKRVFQPMGIRKHVSEDVDGIQSIIYNDLIPAEANWSWVEDATDWIDKSTGETLTGYTPSEAVQKLIHTC